MDKGDLVAVLKKENQFKLLNGFWRNDPVVFKEREAITEDLLDAAAEGKKDQVKQLYTKYVAKQELQNILKYPPPTNRKYITRPDASMGTR